jgi:AsmA protein
MKRVLAIVGVFLVVLLLIVVAVPFFINANTFVPILEQRLSATLGRKVTIGHLSINLFQGGMKADNLTIADDPSFSAQPFVQAKELGVGVDLPLLLFHKQLDVKKLNVVDPQIQLLQKANGKWNYSSLGANAMATSNKPAANQNGSAPPVSSIGSVHITNGLAKVVVEGSPTPRVYSGIDLTMTNFSFTSQFPFQMSANLPSNGKVSVSGEAGPINSTDSSLTPFHADLTMTHIDPVAAGFLDAQAGLSGILDVHAKMASDAVTMTSTGNVTGQQMRFSAHGAPASTPMKLNYTTSYNLASSIGNISNTSLTAGSVVADLTGTYHLIPGHPEVQLKLNGNNLSIDALQALLPAFGVHLPNGSVLRGGTLTTSLAIDGPINNLVITGPVNMTNTQLAGFDLASKLKTISALNSLAGGTGNVTAIQTLRADLNDTPQVITLTNIDTVVPALGQATGNGTIQAGGQLNFHLLAKLSGKSGLGAVANGVMAVLPGLLGQHAQTNGIPLTITGTTSNPQFNVDAGLFKSGAPANSPQKPQSNPVSNVLNGILGKH